MPTDPPSNPTILNGKRILVVEEELLMAMLEADILTAAGCEVIGPAQTVAEAKRLIAETDVDAALVDGTIQGAPATEVAAALRQKNIPFAVQTAPGLYRPGGMPVPAFVGVLFVDKPFNDEQIIATVAALLDRRARP
jgi:DNA-binding response OmpR family regulator